MNFLSIRKASAPLTSCPMHTHKAWELIYQLEAPTTAIADRREYRVTEGELIVIPPETPHRTVSTTPFLDFCILLEHIDLPARPIVVRDTDGLILSLYEILARIRDDRSEENCAILEKLSEALCMAIKKATAERSEPTFVTQFKKTLRENIENPYFDLTDAIRHMGYHPDYFRRAFKRYTSLSPLSFLNRMRIERAKDLLQLESSLSVGEIAARCGFRDPLYFSTAFRREVGHSPLSYRNLYS